MSDQPEDESKRTHKQVAPRNLDLADPARGDDANEFQGYHHDASVSFIVVRVRDATPCRRGPGSAAA